MDSRDDELYRLKLPWVDLGLGFMAMTPVGVFSYGVSQHGEAYLTDSKSGNEVEYVAFVEGAKEECERRFKERMMPFLEVSHSVRFTLPELQYFPFVSPELIDADASQCNYSSSLARGR